MGEVDMYDADTQTHYVQENLRRREKPEERY
jgi:hypothetical protein